MTDQIWKIGTVTVENGSAAFTGTGTGWQTALVTGGILIKAGVAAAIESIDGEEEGTFAQPWSGASGTGVYAIVRETAEAVRAAWTNDRLAQILVRMVVAGIPPSLAGSLAERDALSLGVADDQFIFLRAETGEPWEYYRWSGTAWIGPFDPREAGADGSDGVQSSDDSVTDIVAITQAAYDLLDPPNASTFYIIKPEE